MILHIIRKTDWERAKAQGAYSPDSLTSEGFIHCSTAGQVLGVANELYRGEEDLGLLIIDPILVNPVIKYEDLYELGELYPHIYGTLNTDAVLRIVDFPTQPDGTFVLPAELVSVS